MDRESLTEREAGGYSPLGLAFLGDSVYDTLVREYLLRTANVPVGKYHREKIKLVCAEFQSSVYELLEDELSARELAVMRRGRNAAGNAIPKHTDAVTYRRATAVESLFGYLFLLGQTERIYELFGLVMKNVNIDYGVD